MPRPWEIRSFLVFFCASNRARPFECCFVFILLGFGTAAAFKIGQQMAIDF